MPSSSRSYKYHYQPPPPPPPPPSSRYKYAQQQYESTATDIPLTTVLTCVAAGLLLLYHVLSSYLHALPTPLDAVAAMVGLLFGPAAREHLQNTFATSPRQVVSQVRNRAASLVGRAPLGGYLDGDRGIGGGGGGGGGGVDGGGDGGSDGGTVGGLWNVGNTCYQNSVLQALASLGSLRAWLDGIRDGTAAGALQQLVDQLNQLSEKPRVQTASALITQASGGARGWMFNEQQDAQEFLQGLMGLLEKEVAAVVEKKKEEGLAGLEAILADRKQQPAAAGPVADGTAPLRSPFEGLLAQRVGCLDCGYVESISLQPFTTLSLPIPSTWATTLEDCLRAFTAIEKIPGVDCDKCTLQSVQRQLSNLLTPPHAPPRLPPPPPPPPPPSSSSPPSPSLPDGEAEEPLAPPQAAQETIRARLAAVARALEDDNFTPLIEGVELDGAHKVSSTKTKQVMIARAPQVLVLHTNRSQFDMLTGMAGKNYAAVRFPTILDLAHLAVVTRHQHLSTDPGGPISTFRPSDDDDEGGDDGEPEAKHEGVYELKAVVAHYGGHHNGHYVAYRSWADRWWRISDHEVIPCAEEDALAASNAFMLFYERITPAVLLLRHQRETAIPPEDALLSPLPDSDVEHDDDDDDDDDDGDGDEADDNDEWELRSTSTTSTSVPITRLQLPTPPDSESEDDTVQVAAAAAVTGTATVDPATGPVKKQEQEQTPPPEGPVDLGNDNDDVPELSRDVSSRDSSPETPPPSSVTSAATKRKGKRRARAP